MGGERGRCVDSEGFVRCGNILMTRGSCTHLFSSYPRIFRAKSSTERTWCFAALDQYTASSDGQSSLNQVLTIRTLPRQLGIVKVIDF